MCLYPEPDNTNLHPLTQFPYDKCLLLQDYTAHYSVLLIVRPKIPSQKYHGNGSHVITLTGLPRETQKYYPQT